MQHGNDCPRETEANFFFTWVGHKAYPELLHSHLLEIGANIRKACENVDKELFLKNVRVLFVIPETVLAGAEVKSITLDSLDYLFSVQKEKLEKLGSLLELNIKIRSHLFLSQSFYEYKKRFIDSFCPLFDQIHSLIQAQKDWPITRAIEYINRQYAGKICLEDVASEVMLNPVYFSSLFKKEVGKSFIEYLTECRIRTAQDMVAQGELRIKDICYKVGYTDQRYFSKIFKKYTGLTPSAYRKIHQK
jgi:two-component system response regulator YesN